ncbi:hypothetical protein [Sphingomonas glacialis]|nr:hypothetical protein [Sphingomonas glacialis]
MDIELENAMLVWTRGEKVAVVRHPDTKGLSDEYQSSVGACFAHWRKKDTNGRRLQMMIDAWHVAAFYEIPAEQIHEALIVIPEYRDMLASDCLPKRFQAER